VSELDRRALVQNSLPDLAARINEAHRLAMHHAGEAVAQAIACGMMLLEAKAKVPHGQWLPWLRENIPFGERSAQGYMRLAQRADLDKIKGSSLRDTLKLLATPRHHWKEALLAELELWIAHTDTLKVGRPDDPHDWSHQDAKNCAATIKGIDSIFHRYGICDPEDCTVCDDELEANTQRVADSGENLPEAST
jgi:hypothetical protein